MQSYKEHKRDKVNFDLLLTLRPGCRIYLSLFLKQSLSTASYGEMRHETFSVLPFSVHDECVIERVREREVTVMVSGVEKGSSKPSI